MLHNQDDENARDALAVLTASYEDTGTMTALLDGIAGETDLDTELAAKALGLLGGIAAVSKRLLEYGASLPQPEDREALNDVVRSTGRDVTVHFIEMIDVARRLVDYCSRITDLDNPAILSALGVDLNSGE